MKEHYAREEELLIVGVVLRSSSQIYLPHVDEATWNEGEKTIPHMCCCRGLLLDEQTTPVSLQTADQCRRPRTAESIA